MFHFDIHGLIEPGGSIGQDLANQVRTLSRAGFRCRSGAEVYNSSLYPELKVESFERLPEALDSEPAPVIYNWCDGWHDLGSLLARRRTPLMVRWRNNTPPCFFAPCSVDATSRTLRGYSGILKLVDSSGIRVLANLQFSVRQLAILGIAPGQIRVVHPASKYLRGPPRGDASGAARGKRTLFFVGRTVAHKGHFQVLGRAAARRAKFGIHCRVPLPGRLVDKPKRISLYLQDGVVHQARNRTLNFRPGSIGSSPASIGCPLMMPLGRHLWRIPAARAGASQSVMSTRVKLNRNQASV